MPKSNNLFELYQSAHAAALASMGATSAGSFAAEQSAMKTFSDEGQDPADWEQWKVFFTQRLNEMGRLKMVPTPSAKAAVKPGGKPNAKPASTADHSPA